MSGTLAGAKIDNVESYLAKSGVTFTEGAAVVFTGTDGEVDMPAGDDSLIGAGYALEGLTGDGTKRISVATKGERIPAVAGAAIAAGKRVGTKGTAGKIAASTTAGAGMGTAVTNATSDGDRIYVRR